MHLISMQDQAMTRHLLGTDSAPTRLIFDPSILLTTTLQKGGGGAGEQREQNFPKCFRVFV